MHIYQLTTHLNIGGITQYVFDLSSELLKRGHQVTVVSSGGSCAEAFQKQGITVIIINLQTKSELSPKLLQAQTKLIKVFKEKKPDIVHAHTRVTQILAHRIQRKSQILFVTTCHGFYKRRLGRRLNPAWGDYVIAISEAVAKHLEEIFRVEMR